MVCVFMCHVQPCSHGKCDMLYNIMTSWKGWVCIACALNCMYVKMMVIVVQGSKPTIHQGSPPPPTLLPPQAPPKPASKPPPKAPHTHPTPPPPPLRKVRCHCCVLSSGKCVFIGAACCAVPCHGVGCGCSLMCSVQLAVICGRI